MSSADAKTVLLADDHEDTRVIYGTALAHAGYRVLVAADGREALELAARERPDLAILDLRMPRMDGWKTLELMRADARLAGIPVLALSVVAPGDDRRDSVRRGFDGHYTKPVSPQELIDAVRERIGDPAARPVEGPAAPDGLLA